MFSSAVVHLLLVAMPACVGAAAVPTHLPCTSAPITNHQLNVSAADILWNTTVPSPEACTSACCLAPGCELAALTNATCVLVRCGREGTCGLQPGQPEARLSLWRVSRRASTAPAAPDASSSTMKVTSPASTATSSAPPWRGQRCRPSVSASCPAQQHCVPLTNASDVGVCRCVSGTAPGADAQCRPPDTATSATTTAATPAAAITLLPLVVTVQNRTIVLPEDSADLEAVVLPQETHGNEYQYEWKLLPDGGSSSSGTDAATIGDGSRRRVHLDGLTVGVYVFQLTVTGKGAAGSTRANVTVMPAPRANKPPVAVVSPVNQTLRLPNSKALLDGSASWDEQPSELRYHWELVLAPLGYHQELESSPTLQLESLLPGNYTVRLTVEDAAGETNSTEAHFKVVREPDYAPQANAGEGVIVYLPNNAVTLNGSASQDDKGIVSYEWTKAPGSEDKAVDMQNTHAPYLKLSNLEEGAYTFALKVSDAAGHTSTDTVVVLVKSKANSPPEALVGEDQRLTLPRTWAVLDGSASQDDLRVVSWLWEQISGPPGVKIGNATQSVANATGLTRGVYAFRLTVKDDAGTSSNATANVTVVQATNLAPVADAGGDLTLHLPVSVVTLNGSRSSDDVGIVSWHWNRDPSSLAAGRVVGDTDTAPSLQLVDMVAGQYRFQLTVTDEQGASSSDTVSVVIQPDPLIDSHVRLELDLPLNRWTESQKAALARKVALAAPSSGDVQVALLRWSAQPRSGRLILELMAEDVTLTEDAQPHRQVIAGPVLVSALRDRLSVDPSALDHTVVWLETVTCQNMCSGHGRCEPTTRRCVCDRFWMENVFRTYASGDANCDWSVLYVIIVSFSVAVGVGVGCWAAVCLLRRWFQKGGRAGRNRYSRVGSHDPIQMRPKNGSTNNAVLASETDSESEPLFEATAPRRSRNNNKRRKRNGLLRPPPHKNSKKM